MAVNPIHYRGAIELFDNCKLHNKKDANEFYLSHCGCNLKLAVFATSSIHLSLTIVMWISKHNYNQSIKRLCISFIGTISKLSVLPLWLYSILITLNGDF